MIVVSIRICVIIKYKILNKYYLLYYKDYKITRYILDTAVKKDFNTVFFMDFYSRLFHITDIYLLMMTTMSNFHMFITIKQNNYLLPYLISPSNSNIQFLRIGH